VITIIPPSPQPTCKNLLSGDTEIVKTGWLVAARSLLNLVKLGRERNMMCPFSVPYTSLSMKKLSLMTKGEMMFEHSSVSPLVICAYSWGDPALFMSVSGLPLIEKAFQRWSSREKNAQIAKGF
jgi:hypothetical protein